MCHIDFAGCLDLFGNKRFFPRRFTSSFTEENGYGTKFTKNILTWRVQFLQSLDILQLFFLMSPMGLFQKGRLNKKKRFMGYSFKRPG